MIVTKTPFRISFFGGGTDLPHWSSQFGGSVISTTIDKYCYITCRKLMPFFEYRHRLVYSKSETVRTLDEIQHPGIRGVMQFLDCQTGLEIHHDGDLPARSGLGSSSSFTVGLLRAIYALHGVNKNAQQIAEEAIYVEQKINKETVGSQDQIAASFGGFNKINFLQDGTFTVEPLGLSSDRKEEIRSSLLLMYSGIQRQAPEIEESKIKNFADKAELYVSLSELTSRAYTMLMRDAFRIDEFGQLLDEAWSMKRSLSSKVSNAEMDSLYQRARNAGAFGGKVLGAGGGGFFMFIAPPECHDKIRSELDEYTFVNCGFEDEGSVSYKI